jgi:SAM-dependent methyltransferase
MPSLWRVPARKQAKELLVKPIETEEDFLDLLRASKALAVASAWRTLGLFDALAGGPQPLGKLHANRRALELTAPVLRHLGLLVGDSERVGLSPTARELMDSGALPTARNLDSLADVARMVEVLQDGGPIKDQAGNSKATQGGVRADSSSQTRAFLDMLYRRSSKSAELTLQWLAPVLPKDAAVLDVGGGHGRYARCFADAGHRATLFDLPHVIDYARERHGAALDYIAGDYHEPEDFSGPYDLVFLSNIVHSESAGTNRQLLRRLADATRPGGYVVIKDMFLDERACDPANAAFFDLTMLFYTTNGKSPALNDARQWLTEAKLVDVHITALGGFSLVRARKLASP